MKQCLTKNITLCPFKVAGVAWEVDSETSDSSFELDNLMI